MNQNCKEIWKDVIGFEGFYQVSNLGNVRSVSREMRGRAGGVRKLKGRVLKPYIDGRGYYMVGMSRLGILGNFSIHRLVCSSFHENPDNKPQVNHKDGNKLNNHKDNLEWATKSENAIHAYKLGLSKAPGLRGEKIGSCILSERIVNNIRFLYAEKLYNQVELGKIYSVATTTVSALIRRLTWAHIPPATADGRVVM